MSDVIRLLPDSVANQIAAGEVVQRPSSVVKELLENSIDAGADRIELWLTEAGKNCIQVIDNGKGMSETDARLSFERHATSKITEARDLFNLHTMGFRGEALASIAAVAQVELQTRTANDETGVSITMEGARCTDQHPVMCPVGANFAVRNLFFNVPARRRFLKSNLTEMNNIMQEFERVALANPSVAFRLYKDNTLALDLKGGTFKQRILGLFGNSLDKQLLPLAIDTDIVKVDGFTGTVQNARPKGFRQFFFVNGRYMRHPYFNKAVQAAYERLLPPDKQVSFFLRLTIDPQQIDVNIHPSKTEIKFEDERAIWQLLLVAVRDALGKYNAVPTIDFDNTFDADIPTFNGGRPAAEPTPRINPHYNPFETTASAFPKKHKPSAGGINPYSLIEPRQPQPSGNTDLFPATPDAGEVPASSQTPEQDASAAPLKTGERGRLFQYSSRYIVTSARSGLMVIDYVRAHRRILYDRYMAAIESGDRVSQSLLFPEMVQLTVAQSYVIDSLLPQLSAVGFDIAPAGPAAYAVNAVPAAAADTDVNALINKLVEDYDKQGLKAQDLYHSLAMTLAFTNALPEGRTLDMQEMTRIIDDLFACQTPNYSPDGKLIISIIPEAKIVENFVKK